MCKYACACSHNQRVIDGNYPSIYDKQHVITFSHPPIDPKVKPKCTYGSSCHHLKLRSKYDQNHLDKFTHPISDDEKFFKLHDLVKNFSPSNKDEIRQMILDPSVNLMYSHSHSSGTSELEKQYNPIGYKVACEQRALGAYTMPRFIGKYCDVELFLQTISKPNVRVELATVFEAVRRNDHLFVEAIGKDQIARFLNTQIPIRSFPNPIHFNGSMCERNPSDDLIEYSTVLEEIMGMKNQKVLEKLLEWNLIQSI